MCTKKTTEDFITEAVKKHENRYDYSLVDYLNAKTKVKIICPTHGIFEQIPRQHIRKGSCPKCSKVYMDVDYFKQKSSKLHNYKYDYSLVEYKNSLTPVKIICPIHNMFEQRPKDHLMGKQCQKCSGTYMDTEYFKEKANIVHGFIYSYDKTIFTKSLEKLTITCKKHGDFEQSATSHLAGKGCPICNESKGEKLIRLFLTDNNIDFIRQHKFLDCKNERPLPFDFYLPKFNICIEYHGEQHYKAFRFFGGDYKLNKTQENDAIKLNYCTTNKICLLVISDIQSISKMLEVLKN